MHHDSGIERILKVGLGFVIFLALQGFDRLTSKLRAARVFSPLLAFLTGIRDFVHFLTRFKWLLGNMLTFCVLERSGEENDELSQTLTKFIPSPFDTPRKRSHSDRTGKLTRFTQMFDVVVWMKFA